ncbi:hypothetical protein B0H14DRAFT_3666220 [Mycena olivaceomarginata]|nr:hypothetical protein B0H14DRAFT_3666220 [Mycena olivaceomarginata]
MVEDFGLQLWPQNSKEEAVEDEQWSILNLVQINSWKSRNPLEILASNQYWAVWDKENSLSDQRPKAHKRIGAIRVLVFHGLAKTKALPTGQKVIVTGQVTSQSDPPEAECGSQDCNLPGCNLDPLKLKQRSKLGRRQPRPPEPRQKGRNLPDCYLDPPDPPEPKQTKSRSQLARLRPQAPGTQTKIGTWHVTISIPQNPNGGRSSPGCVLDHPEPKKMSKLRGSEVIKVEISQGATSIARNSAGYDLDTPEPKRRLKLARP